MSSIPLPHYPEMATNSEKRSLQVEIDMLRELGCHRHLVSMLAWCLQGDQLAIVLEYVPGGNLQEFLRSQRRNVKYLCLSPGKRNDTTSIITRLPKNTPFK